MRLRGLIPWLCVVPALAVAASCIPVRLIDSGGYEPASGGAGGAGAGGGFGTTANGPTSAASGGGGDSTSGAMPPTVKGSYQYLCGGSQSMCSPDPGSTDCVQGGNPGIGGAPPEVPDAAVPTCQVVAAGSAVATQCVTAGAGMEDFPCHAASDCQPGYGCATLAPGVSTCRPYCCDSLESCLSGTYCAPRAMAEAPKLDIPVCVVAMTCDLISGQPCQNGEACQIVRNDGTTSCVTPGTGKAGDACPCDKHYTCSWATNTCLELCQTADENACEPTGFCGGGVGVFPDGVGYCQPW